MEHVRFPQLLLDRDDGNDALGVRLDAQFDVWLYGDTRDEAKTDSDESEIRDEEPSPATGFLFAES